MKDVDKLIELFKTVNKRFINNNKFLFEEELNERCVCDALAIESND